MMRTIPLAALAALAGCGAWAQPAGDSPAFEVASVKLSPPPERGQFPLAGMRGGPGSKDPTRIEYRRVSIDVLVARAYDVKQWQLFGPDWTRRGQYDIVATLPPETTRERFQAMLRNLLAERFKLQVHRETRDLTGYSLTVAKSGPKLKPHVDAPPTVEEDQPLANVPPMPKIGADGYPILRNGLSMASVDGKSRKRWDNADVGELVETLSAYLRAPVSDDTGLAGKYDIDLYWVSPAPAPPPDADADPGPDLFVAVNRQLGLKLEKKKAPAEVLVIDHVEQFPTGN